uniref:Uncharacterized protein n=1 Tax=Arundo donax TaxID=35708 RepID=A0A0A9FWI9_ARUDO
MPYSMSIYDYFRNIFQNISEIQPFVVCILIISCFVAISLDNFPQHFRTASTSL